MSNYLVYKLGRLYCICIYRIEQGSVPFLRLGSLVISVSCTTNHLTSVERPAKTI